MKSWSGASWKIADLGREPRVRYVAVAGLNTVVGFTTYMGALAVVGDSRYWLALLMSHVIATTLAFVLYRRFVFLVQGQLLRDYLRFQLVYLSALSLNALLLYALVERLGFNPLSSQAICLLVLALTSYLGHKFFSFYRSPIDRFSPDGS
jgi:putative flippase GtrA